MHEQQWDSQEYARNARFVSVLGEPVVELLAPQPGERVLDLGCGDGALTEKLVQAGSVVVAVDSSPEQVAAARVRGLNACLERAEALPFSHEFDAVFSNAVLHWLGDQEPVIRGVHRALRPGGRFVGEFGGQGNVQSVRTALCNSIDRRGVDSSLVDPWFFPDEIQYRSLLTRFGFFVRFITLFSRPTLLPGDIVHWLEIFARPFLGAVAVGERRAVIEEVKETLGPKLYDPDRGWMIDYVRIRFAADKPAV